MNERHIALVATPPVIGGLSVDIIPIPSHIEKAVEKILHGGNHTAFLQMQPIDKNAV